MSIVVLFNVALFAQTTYVYFQNSTSLDFSVSSVQTGSHTMESNEWWSTSGTINAWQNETNVLWTNRESGIHNGTDFFLTTTLTSGSTSIDLKLKLNGNFIGSDIWSAASGPGFNHSWSSDNNFHSEIFTIGSKQYQLKYTFYFTGGADDILFTLHEIDAFSANPAELNDPSIINVLAYNTFMLTPPISLSDQGTRAQHIDEAVHDLDAILIQEVFDNNARATLLNELSAEYPYQTSVVDLPNILEDGGVMIVSRWPIEYEAQMVFDDCLDADCLSNKGVMYARINKLGTIYHLFSTHQNAQQVAGDPDFVNVRNLQMQDFSAFIDAQNIPANEAVIFGGDMNVDKHANFLNEYNEMFSIFNASEPTYVGHPNTWDKYANHYVDLGSVEPEYLDYVLADNDYLVPNEQSNETWVLRSNHDDMWNIHDLSDHFGVLGRFVFPETINPCASTTITINSSVTEETYENANDGTADITVSGGTAPYTFNWSNGSTTEDLSGLAGGNYTVIVTDANSCSENASITIITNTNCNATIANFSTNPLTHSGNGASSIALSFPTGSKDVSFNISEIGQKTGGKSNRRYIESVTVSYVDGNGTTQNYGTYNGSTTSSASVSILGSVQSVSLQLEDIYDGSTSSTMSVLLSVVDYCVAGPSCDDADNDGICDNEDACPGLDDVLIGTACNDGDVCTENDTYASNCNCEGTFADSDGDGICDANDICPGGDDSVDTDNDGIPDFCDNGGCTAVTNTFSSNTLTHSGSGSNSTTLNLAVGSSDIDFTISNIGSKTNGKGSGRYIESVAITYVDGNGATQNYGTFNGSGSVNVSITDIVQSITVSLSDSYDGNSSTLLSVNLSDVTSCSMGGVRKGRTLTFESNIELYPNPTTSILNIRSNEVEDEELNISVYSIDGQEVFRKSTIWQRNIQLDVSNLIDGIYLIQIWNNTGVSQSMKFIKQ